MDAPQVLAKLLDLDATPGLSRDGCGVTVPMGLIDQRLREAIRANKAGLLELIREAQLLANEAIKSARSGSQHKEIGR